MLLIIGGRHLTFRTLYGIRIHWACGATLALAVYLLAASRSQAHVAAFAGSAIETAFAATVLIRANRAARV